MILASDATRTRVTASERTNPSLTDPPPLLSSVPGQPALIYTFPAFEAAEAVRPIQRQPIPRKSDQISAQFWCLGCSVVPQPHLPNAVIRLALRQLQYSQQWTFPPTRPSSSRPASPQTSSPSAHTPSSPAATPPTSSTPAHSTPRLSTPPSPSPSLTQLSPL